ncbi:hypothetical protein [Oceanobacillus oncorhynchi]|uniref:hypothetical protein n=1 Tax=Oceanobacillus oncorhynchi TaxID=545501 RepID=UPI002116A58E|nr:hypothetical protein [Oceanobacillus oncorhynchi]UUI38715.1 hypothetical protein NP440_15415 [Oceanobacillus oncorhynchi]
MGRVIAMVFGGTSNRSPSPSGKIPQEKSDLLFFYPQGISATLALSAPVGLPIAKSSFHPRGISATLALSAPVSLPIAKSSFHPRGISATLALSAPVSLPIAKSSFHPRGISATLALSAPVSLPIAKSSLKEMSSGPTESGVCFWGLRLLPP